MRDDMRVGDGVLYYHSNCPETGVVGTAVITSEAYPDPTAFDRDSKYFDPKSDTLNPRWYVVDVKLRRKLKRVITLAELKRYTENSLRDFPLLRRGNRLSIMPVSKQEWDFILGLE